ncbi:MAG: hypothetical protein V2A73_09830 [Pseudomonadota bacterium]
MAGARRRTVAPQAATIVFSALVAIVSLVGCQDRSSTGSASAADPGSSYCDRLIPVEARERLFPGATLNHVTPCAGCPEQCRFRKSGSHGALVTCDCRVKQSAEDIRDIKKMTMAQNGTFVEVSGLGRGCLRNRDQVMLWDGDTGCYVTIMWPGGDMAALELAKEVEAALTPATIGLPFTVDSLGGSR